jgi:isoamylase
MGRLGQQVQEFRGMVRALHVAGIEVVLDVVYNHTAEGDHRGPTLSMRGIDNAAYYRLADDNPARYVDYTGCGNSLNVRSPNCLQLIMDSLRYWVQEMHVDGFRFDLAATLAREFYEVDRLSTFFEVVQQDPVVSSVKLIAEPWDVGPGGYQVGNFPPLWTEWNGRYRDTVRDFWRGRPGTLADFATRVSGSADLYQEDCRRPMASINFVTCHDGFTLNDLVSYNEKHNEANGENNRDGTPDNRSWNCGVEGPTEDPAVLALRAKQKRNLLATLFLSQGVPMLSHGDELGRTQHGNNNAYCHDSELSWVDWDEVDERLRGFVSTLSAFRARHRVFRRRRFFTGAPVARQDAATPVADMQWFAPDGRRMAGTAWDSPVNALGVFVNGEGIKERGRYGQRHVDDSFLLLFNGHDAPVDFTVPPAEYGEKWRVVVDTAQPGAGAPVTVPAAAKLTVPDRSLLVLDREV